jgi:ubiquinone/menaquinone biosynthesis C-methylase UbiE
MGKAHAEPDMSYFELQAYVGTTKHMGGLKTTQALIELCHIGAGMVVLDVGCGAGATTCGLAQTVGCRVVGVDLRDAMVALAEARAEREGVTDLVTFRVADVCELPFDDGSFDVVLCESVLTFVEDKARAIGELVRVAKAGGYVGLNEQFWRQPPTPEIVAYARLVWGIESALPGLEDWVRMLERAGLRDLLTQPATLDPRREATQVVRYRFRDMWRMIVRTLRLFVRSAAFRAYMRARRGFPRDTFRYLGYALFVGVKG